MSFPVAQNSYGLGIPLSNGKGQIIFPLTKAPTPQSVNYPIGAIGVIANTAVYFLLGFSSAGGTLSATWIQLANSSGDITAVTGTTNQVTATTSAGTATLSIPATFIAPGSITASAGAITATAGNLVLGTAGNKLVIATGSNASTGTTAVMSGSPGAVTTATTACTASSIILFSRDITGGTPGQVSITAQSAGSFTLTSTGNETSTFNYLIIN